MKYHQNDDVYDYNNDDDDAYDDVYYYYNDDGYNDDVKPFT